ncbi:MAG: NAD(P)(+) transhydrogenase (Re/Si-specific) subunit beta, partial [Leptospiraceae bacterium]|nr:NAD(P)(+) transhydrogenase (Re/Si-specific) subunit beta [Leptospiraceae bacterium]
MIEQIKDIAYLVSSVLFIFGIKQLGAVRTARQGNFLAALGMFIAVAVTLFQELSYELIIAGIMIGSLIGVVLALRIQMTGMPQMVALLNGFGGIGSLLVASAEYIKDPLMGPETGVTVVLSVLIGGVTFTGSLVAFGKLQGIVTEKSVMFPGQHLLNLILILIGVALGVLLNIDGFTLGSWFNAMSMDAPSGMALISTVIGLSLLLGVLLVIPIGGADMPVVISLLNSYSGIAAATTGFVLGNKVLIITGAL